MVKVTLHQELQASVILKQAKRSKMGGWKDPYEAHRPQLHPLKGVLEDIRYRRNPYLERKDPASLLIRQSIIRSKTNRDVNKLALQQIPIHTRCLRETLSDIRNLRAAYFERTDAAKRIYESIKRIQLNRQLKQVTSSTRQFQTDRLILLNSIQSKMQNAQKEHNVDTKTAVRPTSIEDIGKNLHKELLHKNGENEADNVNVCPDLETVLFDQDDFSFHRETHNVLVLRHLSCLEQMMIDLSQEMKRMRSQMQEMIKFSAGVQFQEVTFLSTSHSLYSTNEDVCQTENTLGMGPTSAIVLDDNDDWVDVS